MKVKLCGLRRIEDIGYANVFRPDYVGFVFAPSKRQVTPDIATELNRVLEKDIKSVGVFVNEEPDKVIDTARTVGLDVVQLHGDEGADYIDNLLCHLKDTEIWKAVRVINEKSIVFSQELPAHKLVLDAFSADSYGGSGKTADWDMILRVRDKVTKSFFLAGGMNIDNLLYASQILSPYGIDISSGIETAGFKDKEKIKAVMQLIRGV